jgi:hypothetical protein
LVFLFYSIGLLAYETILPLGFILMMLEYSSQDNRKKRVIDYALLTLLVLTLHFLLRIFFSGNLFQGYAANIPNSAPGLLFNHIIRIVARQFVPPIANTFIFVCISLSVLLLIGFIIVRVKSSVRKFQENRALFYFLLVGWLVSMLVAFSFPVSTKTSESDRLLYLPSMFLCSIFAYAIVVFLRSLIIRGGVVVLYCSAGALGIFQNASHWQIASKQTLEIIASVARYAEKGKNVYVINLPDQVQGAFVFRNGFYPALLLNKVDTTGIRLGAAIIQNSEGSRVANQDGSIVGKLVKENAICLEWDGKLLQKVFPVATSKP